jgi:signal peptidase I
MKYRYLLILPLLWLLAGCDSSGDRVLVAKFVYDTGLAPAHRYDVVVFKYPRQPVENGTPKNYIKRLLGLPGEILAIFFGQLYTFTLGDKLPDCISEEEWRKLTDPNRQVSETMRLTPLTMWEYPPKDHPTAQKLWDAGQFTILRKPPDVMVALSRPVYDNDHPAKDLIKVLPERWAPQHGAAWTADDKLGFSTDGGRKSEQWLRYRHIKRPQPGDWPSHLDPKGVEYDSRIQEIKNRKHWPQLITDFMGYNTYEASRQHQTFPQPNWVGDLMLDCNVAVDNPQGEFWMELSRGADRFQARFDLTSGTCSLYRWTNHVTKKATVDGVEQDVAVWQLLGSAETRVKAKGSYHIRFANYDQRLTLWVDRDRPFGDGKEYPPPVRGEKPNQQVMNGPDDFPDTEAFAANNMDMIKNNDLQPASLCSVGAAVQIHQLKLWRNTYYTGSADHPSDCDGCVSGDDWRFPDKWASLRKLAVHTWYIYPGHYMCLGDNSPESSDSRYWGLVPERLMLGRALLVYFPFERAGTIK